MPNDRKVLLIILDGYGEGKDYFGNAITNAQEHFVEKLRAEYPCTLLKTDSEAVGLPKNTMGGSEVGHFTMGAGRVVFQMLELINRTIEDQSFFSKPEFIDAIKKVKSSDKAALHLVGMISDAGVHSHQDHLYALLKLAKDQGLTAEQVYIHAITDGRDVPEKCAKKYLQAIEEKTAEIGIGKIATICGRFFTMDRDKNYDRTQKAYDLMTKGQGHEASNPLTAIDQAYERGDETDYYIEPIILDKDGLIKEKDVIINFNYRSDRAAQITTCFTDKNFSDFETPIKCHYVCFGPYSKIAPVAFPPPEISNNLGEILSNNNFEQLRMAETEKFPHVTFFFNSQNKEVLKGENRIVVDSPKVASYAEKPEMSARELTEAFVQELNKKSDYKLIVMNYANADLVGHSGELEPTKESLDVINECLKTTVSTAQEKGYDIIITADHGNAEYMVYEDSGDPCPSHTFNKVIFMIISNDFKEKKLRGENVGLRDVAPTVLDMLNITKPAEMTGESLIME